MKDFNRMALRSFRSIILLFLCAGGISPRLMAQRIVHRPVRIIRPNTNRIAQAQTRIMEKRINLKPSQLSKVNQINSEFLHKITDLQDNPALNQEEKIKVLQELRAAKTNSLKEVLDEKQFQDYLKLHQELQEQRSKRIQSVSGSDPIEPSEE